MALQTQRFRSPAFLDRADPDLSVSLPKYGTSNHTALFDGSIVHPKVPTKPKRITLSVSAATPTGKLMVAKSSHNVISQKECDAYGKALSTLHDSSKGVVAYIDYHTARRALRAAASGSPAPYGNARDSPVLPAHRQRDANSTNIMTGVLVASAATGSRPTTSRPPPPSPEESQNHDNPRR